MAAVHAQTGDMITTTSRIGETVALLALLYGARRYYRNWGATKAECQMALPADSLAGDPALQTTEAVYVDAPLSVVWPSLMEMFSGRAAVCTCAGSNAESLLAEGDLARLTLKGFMGLLAGATFNVVEIEPEKHIVLNVIRPDLGRDVTWSFHLQPHWKDRVRLLIRSRIALCPSR